MERHSTGINPFTGDEAGVDPETGEPKSIGTDPETGEEIHMETAIPEEQQVDPHTGDPLYHRYVGYGSNLLRIPWPWEQPKTKKKDAENPNQDRDEEENKGLVKRTTSKVKSLFRKEPPKPKPAAAAEDNTPEEMPDAAELERQPPIRPRDDDELEYDDDTSLNVVEVKLGDFHYAGHFIPTLTVPPHPRSVCAELAELKSRAGKYRSPMEAKQRQLQSAEAKAAAVANKLPQPKTPRQVFTELRLARKKAEQAEVVPFMAGLDRGERREVYHRFGLSLAEQFARRLQGEKITGGGCGDSWV